MVRALPHSPHFRSPANRLISPPERLQNFFGLCRCGGAFIYLCSADSKRLAACAFRHKLSAFLCRLCCPAGAPCCQKTRAELPHAAAVCCTKVSHTRLSMKVVCHETPARFLWILPAQRAGAAGRAPGAKSPRLPGGRAGEKGSGAGVTRRWVCRPHCHSRSWRRRRLCPSCRC